MVFHWSPAHLGLWGNERAEEAVKRSIVEGQKAKKQTRRGNRAGKRKSRGGIFARNLNNASDIKYKPSGQEPEMDD